MENCTNSKIVTTLSIANKSDALGYKLRGRLSTKNALSSIISSADNQARNDGCLITQSGLTPIYGTYYLCECDQERRNPICESCFNLCHKGEEHCEIKMFKKEEICMCGFKCHLKFNEADSDIIDMKYQKHCLFGDWAVDFDYKVFFRDINDPTAKICLLCKNLCYKNSEDLIKTTIDKEGISKKDFKCTCKNHNHEDKRIIFRKLKSIAKKNNFLNKYNFEDFTYIQLVNAIFRGKKSFENIFSSLASKIKETYLKITKKNDYFLEDLKFITDLHLTSDILSMFSKKCKNIYKLKITKSHLIPNSNTNNNVNNNKNEYKKIGTQVEFNLRSNTIMNNSLTNEYKNECYNLTIYCTSLLYFKSKIQDILPNSFYFTIMQKEFDYKSLNIWLMKENLTNIFMTFCIGRDFTKYPSIKVKDIMLLNPLQRQIWINNIQKEEEINNYIYNINTDYLENILNIIFKMVESNELNKPMLSIYNKLYKICQIFAKFSLFNHEKVEKLCKINNKLILSFLDVIKEDKKSIEQQKLKLKVLSPMMKCNIYIAYYFNDQMLISYLKGERELKDVNFFHMKNNLTKILVENSINCLSYIQELSPEFNIEYFQDDIKIMDDDYEPFDDNNGGLIFDKGGEIEKSERFKTDRFKSNKSLLDTIKDNNKQQQKKKLKKTHRNQIIGDFLNDLQIKKCVKNIVFCAHDLIHLILGLPENYMTGLTRLSLSNYSENFYNCLIGKFKDFDQKYIQNLKGCFQKIEEKIYEFFNSFSYMNDLNIDSSEINKKFSEDFNNILVQIINISSLNNFNLNFQEDSLDNEKISKRSKTSKYNANSKDSINYNKEKSKRDKRANYKTKENDSLDEENSPICKSNYPQYRSIRKISREIYENSISVNQENLPFDTRNQILCFNTYIINSVFKIIQVFYSLNLTYNNHINNREFIIEENMFNNILTIAHFFIQKNVDNSIFLLTSDIISSIELLYDDQLYSMLDLIETALRNIYVFSAEITINKTLIHLLKIASIKSKKSIELIDKILRIIKIIIKINFNDEQNVIMKLRKVIMKLYNLSHEDVVDFKFLINIYGSNSKEMKNLANVVNIPTTTKNGSMRKSMDLLTDVKIQKLLKILKKYLFIINKLFEGNAILEERRFLENILIKEDIKKILQNKNLELSMRIELLIFYRLVYIDTTMKKSNINYYISALITEPKVKKLDETVDNQKYYRFFENLIKINTNINPSNNNAKNLLEKTSALADDYQILKFELVNVKDILEKNQDIDLHKKTKYIEYGIIKSLCVYFSKFSALVFDCSGYDYIHYYELLYYFLELKKYICFNSDNCLIENKRKLYNNVFRNTKCSFGLKDENLINLENLEDEKKLINEDLNRMVKNNFEILNFSAMNSIFQNHTKNFLIKFKFSGLKDLFEKKDEVLEDEQIEEMKNILLSYGQYNTKFQISAFDVITYYINQKALIEKTTFIKMLNEDNMYFNCKERLKLIKNLLFYMTNYNYETKFSEQCYWEIFRLLQYDTTETQSACLELIDKDKDIKKPKLLNFDLFLQKFTLNIMSILNRDINPCVQMIKHDYYLTLMIVKILKYFCEEHNQEYQRLFFIKEDNGVKLHYNPDQYEQYIAQFNDIALSDKDNVSTPNDTITDNLINSMNLSQRDKANDKIISDLISNSNDLNNNNFPNKSKRPNPDSEIEDLHEVTRSEQNEKIMAKNKASVFEYMISILSKLILLSKWTITKNEELYDDYLYDLYFVILEFLIETIQGTRKENLEAIFLHESNGNNRNLFGLFLLEINRLVLEENDSELSYQVRKDMMDFLMAFLEESATPENGIIEISSIILPISILESIVLTMNKLYEKKQIELMENKLNLNNPDKKNSLENINSNSNKGNSFLEVNTLRKENYKFSPEMKEYFTNEYFSNLQFGEDIQFSLANRMFQFFKQYSIEESFKNPAVSEFYEKMDMFTEAKILKFYYNQNKMTNQNMADDKSTTVTDSKFYDNYLCVSFFESITRVVFVNKLNSDKPVRVLFTLNPIVPLLSKNTKDDFVENVDRSDRYSKLFSLVESCDYFFQEVQMKQKQGKSNVILKIITDLNFYWLEVFAFGITFATNFYMLCVLSGEGGALFGDPKVNKTLDALGLTNFIFNLICLILWLYSKFNLFYLSECSKLLKSKEIDKINDDDPDGEEEEAELNIYDKINAGFIVLVLKNKIFGFIWNIIFSCAAYFTKEYFLYIVEIFSIVNLSQTLRNLIFSLTIKINQLGAVFFLTIILNYTFSVVAFFNFSEDFIKSLSSKAEHLYPSKNFNFLKDIIGAPYRENSHIENECGTLLYCFATHLDYGMRFDGGIADRMEKASYTHNRQYYMGRFFYEEAYFISLVILMLNMIFGIVIEAFGELRANEQNIEKDKSEICFICGIDKETCEKRGEKLNEHTEKVHNIWTYVEYMLGLRYVDIQETNAINSFVIESLQKKELTWFPYDEANNTEEDKGDVEE